MDFFKRRNHVLYPTRVNLDDHEVPSYWKMRPAREVYPGSNYEFELGGVKFVVIAPENTGEGEDGILLWLPQSRVLFTGDLFGTLYPMFPNLYTVRGEKYRDPLDYIDALDLVLSLRSQGHRAHAFPGHRRRGLHPGVGQADARRGAVRLGRDDQGHECGEVVLGADAGHRAARFAPALARGMAGFRGRCAGSGRS